jgi:protein-tyrosine phosphatase
MAAPSSDGRAERSSVAQFGDVPLEKVDGVLISKSISDWLVEVIKEIDENEKTGEEDEKLPHDIYHLDFPSAFTNLQRKKVHQYAYELKLRSTSHGVGEVRYIRVTLMNRGGLFDHVLSLVQSTKLQEAILHRETKKHSKVPVGMSLICEHLYLGSGKDAKALDTLKDAGVTIVLNVTAEWTQSHLDSFTHHKISLNDTVKQSISEAMKLSCQIIKEAKDSATPQKVLVHCVMGRSRSASMVIAYLVAHENMTLMEAFEHTRKMRPIIRPNSGFMAELVAWEKLHRGASSLDVETWVSLVGVHGSEKGHPAKKELPPRVNLPKDDARKAVSDLLIPILSETFLHSVVTKHCNQTFSTPNISKFMIGVKKELEANASLTTPLLAFANHADVIKTAQADAKPWFVKQIPPAKKAESKAAPSNAAEECKQEEK